MILHRYSSGTSSVLQWYFIGTSSVLHWYFWSIWSRACSPLLIEQTQERKEEKQLRVRMWTNLKVTRSRRPLFIIYLANKPLEKTKKWLNSNALLLSNGWTIMNDPLCILRISPLFSSIEKSSFTERFLVKASTERRYIYHFK